MKFKELSVEDKQYLRELYYSEFNHEERIKAATKRYGVTGRAIRKWWKNLGCSKYGYVSKQPLQLRTAAEREIHEDTRVLLVGSAQNQTPANFSMISNMVAYAEFIESEFGLKTEILITPSRYRNPTTPREDNEKKVDMWWDKKVDEFLHYGKRTFGNCLISADSRITPTAENPLAGYEALARHNHLILGHSRLHLKTMPRFKGEKQTIMCTTGFCTMRNYSESKAGDKGYIHHSYGFVVLEKREDNTLMPPRQVKCKTDGSFIDVRFSVKKGEVKVIDDSDGYIFGDVHYREVCGKKMGASLRLADSLKPDNIVLHDVYDGSVVNPHERDNLYTRKKKIKQGLHLIREEVDESIQFLKDMDEHFNSNVYVVHSNHDDFLDRHINKFNWKNDLHNSEAYLDYAKIQQSEDLDAFGNIYGYLVSVGTDFKVKYVKGEESLIINGYQCGSHGDKGLNGARGNINSFKRFNFKMIFGHSHSPELKDGATCVGVSCNLWQGYNSNGLSSWAYADAIIHKNGKSQLIIFDEFDLEFTLMKYEAEGKTKEDAKS